MEGEIINAEVAKMTADKWATFAAADVNLGDWGTAGFDVVKEGTRLHLQNYAQSRLLMEPPATTPDADPLD